MLFISLDQPLRKSQIYVHLRERDEDTETMRLSQLHNLEKHHSYFFFTVKKIMDKNDLEGEID